MRVEPHESSETFRIWEVFFDEDDLEQAGVPTEIEEDTWSNHILVAIYSDDVFHAGDLVINHGYELASEAGQAEIALYDSFRKEIEMEIVKMTDDDDEFMSAFRTRVLASNSPQP